MVPAPTATLSIEEARARRLAGLTAGLARLEERVTKLAELTGAAVELMRALERRVHALELERRDIAGDVAKGIRRARYGDGPGTI